MSYLFDERKSARSTQDIERLAKEYGIDASKLENLARYVSSPSVQSGSEKRTVEKDGEESVMIQVSTPENIIHCTHPLTPCARLSGLIHISKNNVYFVFQRGDTVVQDHPVALCSSRTNESQHNESILDKHYKVRSWRIVVGPGI